jgi:hypothetical protein
MPFDFATPPPQIKPIAKGLLIGFGYVLKAAA